MPKKIGIIVCDNLAKELRAIIAAEKWDDVEIIIHKCGCFQKFDESSEADLKYMEDISKVTDDIHSLCYITADAFKKIKIKSVYNDLCYKLIADDMLIEACVKKNDYILTPGWLAKWRYYVEKKWKFDAAMAKDFFRDSGIERAVLLDTGIYEHIDKNFEEFAVFTGLKKTSIQTGLSHLKLNIEKIVSEWRFKNIEEELKESLAKRSRDLSGYLMAFDAMNDFARHTSEDKVAAAVMELFSSLFAPEKISYISISQKRVLKVWRYPGITIDETDIPECLKNFDGRYFASEKKGSFALKVFAGDEHAGTICLENIRFRQFMDNYLNLASSVIDICGLAVSNARKFKEISDNKIMIEEEKEFLSTVIQNIGDAALAADSDGTVMLANDEAEKLFGNAGEKLNGSNLFKIFKKKNFTHNDENAGCALAEFMRSTAAEKFSLEFTVPSKNRMKKTIQCNASRIFGNGKKPRGIVCIFFDTTKRAEFENALKKAREESENTSRMKSLFLANMSHEVKTPLNAMIGFSDLLAETGLNSDQTELLEYVRTSGHALFSLVNNILDFSKIEAGKIDMDKAEFDLKKAVSDAFSISKIHAKNKGIEVILKMDEKIGGPIIGDQMRLKQVLVNLLTNALKFTAKGRVGMDILLAGQSKSNMLIEFSVWDEGIGIEADKLELIFSPFVQVSGSVERNYGGTGLGLPISNNLVKLMGGHRIYVESKAGAGCRFYFRINFEKGREQAASPIRSNDGNNMLSIPGRSYRILIAEDDEANRTLMTRALIGMGHIPVTAENGRHALLISRKEEFDAVLMDIQMPVMDGITAAKTIRKKDKKTPIIAMTAGAIKGDREKCLDAGMNELVEKPIKLSEFNAILKKVIG